MTPVLPPGRYVVHGGPGGRTSVIRPRADRYAIVDGRRVHYIGTDCSNPASRWPVLARIRVRPGHRLTWDGLWTAVGRVWSYQ